MKLATSRELSVARKAVAASNHIAFDLRKAVKIAWIRNKRLTLKTDAWDRFGGLLRQSMVAGHLQGMQDRTTFLRKHLSLAHEDRVFDKTIRYLQKRLKLKPDQLDRIQSFYGARALRIIDGASSFAEKRLQKTFLDLTEKGAHVREGIEALDETLDGLGLSPMKDHQLETIFRTQTRAAYSAGQWMADQDEAIKEILWGYTYAGVMDARERESHVLLEEVTLPADHEFWQFCWPPNGWNCRCDVIPLFDPAEEIDPPEDFMEIPDDGFGMNLGAIIGGDVPEVSPDEF